MKASIDDSGTILTVEGLRLDTIPCGLLRFVRGRASKRFSTTRGLVVEWAWHTRLGEGSCVWWFPGSNFVAVLTPKTTFQSTPTPGEPLPKGHPWQLLHTSPFLFPLAYRHGWAWKVIQLAVAGDIDGLLAMAGVTKEVIEIH